MFLQLFGASFTEFLVKTLLVYYGYRSFQAIETEEWHDDAHWLTFWLLYSFIQFIQTGMDYFLYQIPFYAELKLGLFVYMGLFGGATQVYEAIGKRAIKMAEVHLKTVQDATNANPNVQKLKEQLKAVTNKKE
eukprot:NODE_2613_length_667_cov_124.359223_g2148_i0.p1 GENE.NODE_2613_length_667_cov_124.359223_g2148_i0~~NODE_2613_length_667_cov_124.359223_g2148_i0.p1  ORF type:complete len:144 (+),score=47.51 NODE_2613_length_667_cov_124.359223_g2148_i0:34-432(+)